MLNKLAAWILKRQGYKIVPGDAMDMLALEIFKASDAWERSGHVNGGLWTRSPKIVRNMDRAFAQLKATLALGTYRYL